MYYYTKISDSLKKINFKLAISIANLLSQATISLYDFSVASSKEKSASSDWR